MYLPTRGTLLERSVNDFFDDVNAICFLIFFIKAQVDAIQSCTHYICLYKVDKKYTELLDCALIGVCAVIRANTVKYTELLDCALTGVCAVIRANTVCCEYSLEVPCEISNVYTQHVSVTNLILWSSACQESKSYNGFWWSIINPDNVIQICNIQHFKYVFFYLFRENTNKNKFYFFWTVIYSICGWCFNS